MTSFNIDALLNTPEFELLLTSIENDLSFNEELKAGGKDGTTYSYNDSFLNTVFSVSKKLTMKFPS